MEKLNTFFHLFIQIGFVCFSFVFILQASEQMTNFLELIYCELKVFTFQGISIFDHLQHFQASPFLEKNLIRFSISFIEHFDDGGPQKQR